MKLTVIIPEINAQSFACHGCTNCCRDLVVHLTSADQKKIDAQNWGEKIEGLPYVRLKNELVLNHARSGGCIFLLPDGKCRIHVEFGATAKPLACQLYPFTLEPDPAGLRAGLRFDCPTVGRSAGQKIGAHKGELTRIAAELEESAPQVLAGQKDRVFLTDQRPCTPQELEIVTSCVDEWLANTNRTLGKRLQGLCSVVRTLQGADLRRLDAARLIELTNLLFAEAGSNNADKPPTASVRQKKLLLQAVYSHCEQITFEQARRGGMSALMYRWGQLRRAHSLSAGVGLVPPLVAGIGSVEHELVIRTEIDPDDAPRIDELLTRYLRMKVLSHGVFGHGYYGWTILDGMNAMLLSVAVIGWLSRYVAAGQGADRFGTDHVMKAVAIVDRAAGRVPELGSRSGRLRVKYLSSDQGIMRVMELYPVWNRDAA